MTGKKSPQAGFNGEGYMAIPASVDAITTLDYAVPPEELPRDVVGSYGAGRHIVKYSL